MTRTIRTWLLTLFAVAACPLSAHAEAVIGTTRGKVYHTHTQDCASARQIRDDNIVRFASRKEAEEAGRRLCRVCARLDEKAKSDGGGDKADPPKRNPPKQTPKEPVDSPPDEPAKVNGQTAPPVALPEFARMRDVSDAGTIELDTGDKLCMLGIVVPARGQPLAREAARFMKEQTRDRILRIHVFTTACMPNGRDALGRWCASITPQPDGRDLAGELLFQGYAWLDREHATARSAEYSRLEEAALNAGRGIWRPLEGKDGERTVVTGRGATAYHDEKCPHVNHLTNALPLTVNEARARRLVPCSEYRAKGGEKTAAP